LPVRQRDLNLSRAVDDVAVGENQPFGREHEAGPRPLLRRTPAPGRGTFSTDVDTDDRRGDSFDGFDDRPRLGIQQVLIGVGVADKKGTRHIYPL
jgi:hypothetical protein